MALLGDSIGLGLGLQGKPDVYAGIYERGIARREAQRAAKAKQDEESWRKYLDDIKVDPKIYHTSQIPKISERAAKHIDRLDYLRRTRPNDWLNAAERENAEYKRLNAIDAIVAENYRTIEKSFDSLDPEQKKVVSIMKTATTDDEMLEKISQTPAYRAGAVTIDPENKTVGIAWHDPKINLTQRAGDLINKSLGDIKLKIGERASGFSDYEKTYFSQVPQTEKDADFMQEKLRQKGIDFRPISAELVLRNDFQDPEVQQQFVISNVYKNPEKLNNAEQSFVDEYKRLARGKFSTETRSIPQSQNIDPSSQSENGKVNYAVSEKKGNEILGSFRPEVQPKVGAKINTDDTFTVVDFARNDATKNKPIILDDQKGKPVIMIPRRMIKNNRTGAIDVVGIKTERVEGWESVVGEPEGEIVALPYDRNREALAVETDKLTWEYAMKHGKKGEVQQTSSSNKTDFRKKYNY